MKYLKYVAMQHSYLHLHAILKDGTLQICANREKEPIFKHTESIGKTVYRKAHIEKWQFSHEYFPFASEGDEQKVISNLFLFPDSLKELTLYEINLLKQGISVIDRIEIKEGKAYFKEVKSKETVMAEKLYDNILKSHKFPTKKIDLNPPEYYQPLFDLMSEHNLTLLEGEMDEIIHCVMKMISTQKDKNNKALEQSIIYNLGLK